MLHRLVQDSFHRCALILSDLKHQFIVYLQQDTALEAFFLQPAVRGNHRQFDDIRCTAWMGVFIAMRSASIR